jgi:hypothetical protein
LIVIGADSHKRTHTVVALDAVGRRLGEKTVPTTSDGHLALVTWAAQWPQVKLLADYRRDLVLQRTRVQNQLRWHLHELDPALHVVSRTPGRYRVMNEIAERLEAFSGVVARLARELLGRCRDLTVQIKASESGLRILVRRLARPCWRCPAAACSAPR